MEGNDLMRTLPVIKTINNGDRYAIGMGVLPIGTISNTAEADRQRGESIGLNVDELLRSETKNFEDTKEKTFYFNVNTNDQEIPYDGKQSKPFILPGISVEVIDRAFHKRHYPLFFLKHPRDLLLGCLHKVRQNQPKLIHFPIFRFFLEDLHVCIQRLTGFHEAAAELRDRTRQPVSINNGCLLHMLEIAAQSQHHLEPEFAVVLVGFLGRWF
ncbi:hypothetical protein OSB04_un000958 [Centaurea solstitialis]|uniref:Uncharacterized protein n=1 Tax=Centaurea solstitialis TaxID=347529 RepID=A0AA38SGQ7_9ASTR|nr:hypothetical protein OSB04_un000958 [Centaurea solstitialis]